ncbi:Mrp/NBP35 family ATP-binding protein [Actinomycetospora cinnamomea]|uniref:Iron-sulfur cluster carrier protein n=1 Tax=Actinomycetospora cinnamomea TaxID=663609 RepID=A0A2U1F2I6_9PSEU|nr:Mrp/NBP35 family ATP-binding protein [Actinomycetospora cinnamomea]PVZ06378.1 ATP-binding protein involved in chromosome partitioning [Actinomycetospora cinnamomea]
MSVLTRRRGPAVDPAAVRAAVDAVVDPELGRPLGELGAVDEVTHGRGGRVLVRVATPTHDVAPELVAAVRAAAEGAGAGRVAVETTPMTPRRRAELAERLAAAAAPRPGGPAPRVYAVASGKGGVGKSTVTANLATALAASGQRVGLIDADVWGYSVPQLFGVRRHPVVLGEKMQPVRAHGVALMSTGFFVDEDDPVIWRGPMLHKALQQFVTDVAWGPLDVLLVDLPPGTGDATLSVLELLPDAALLAVTTPQTAARVVARRVVRMATESGAPLAGVVENMAGTVCVSCGETSAVFGSGGGELLADEAGTTLLGRVPLDVPLREAGDRGVPVVLDAPGAPSARELTRVAATLPARRRSLVGRALPLTVCAPRT